MSLIRLEGVVREIGTFVILDQITAAIAPGERVGLVGPNGAGKTTLLRIAAGQDEPDRGTATRKRGLSLGLLSQEAHFDEAFMAAPDLRSAVRHGAAHLERMAEELGRLEHDGHAAGTGYADLQHRFEILGGYTLDQRVDEALSGLGFARDEWTRPPTAISGGQQTRAALARLVIADPDLLLLDEPTNHLDIGAIEWLEEHLRRRTGALLVASHDRAFLDATVARVWELRDRRLTVFRGDYSSYHRQRVERDARAERESESHEDAIAREIELVQRYRSQRKHVKMHEHEARLERLREQRVETPKAGKALKLPGNALAGGPVRSGELVIRLEDLAVGYLPGRGALAPDGSEAAEPVIVARSPFLAAQRGERIGIVGPNGAGKTTLLRTIAGDLPALDGAVTFGHNVSPAYLAQLRDAAIPGATVLDAILEAIPVTPGEARGYLARFLFRGDDAFKEVRLLSGGERSRLELALLGILPSNLMLLDEPTNHLDIAAREAIEAFLAEAPATILVVSHDRRLLETICERLWVVDDGLAVPFDGGYRAWRAAVADGWTVQAEAARRANRGKSVPGARTPARAGEGVAASGTGNGSRTPDGSGPGPVQAQGASEAVEGGVPAPARDARQRAVAARPPAQPAPARDRHPGRCRELRGDAPRDQRARRRRAGARRCRGRVARARRAGPVTPGARDAGRPGVRIGITGPIGCGKSQVARWLGELGATVVDADDVARSVTAPGQPAHDAVIARFGPEVVGGDGTLDRAALARIVFADPAQLRDLEEIVHPAVRPRILEAIAAADAAGAPAVAIEAIRLVEGGLAALCDEVWLVTCDPTVQRARVLARGMTEGDADRRIGTQADLVARISPGATRVLDASGDPDATRVMVAAAFAAATGHGAGVPTGSSMTGVGDGAPDEGDAAGDADGEGAGDGATVIGPEPG